MGTSPYEAWEVKEEAFPRSGTRGEQLKFLVRYAILAPSAHNTQPWHFRVAEDRVDLLADTTRALAVSDPTHREMYLSLGCALENLLVAAEYFGLPVSPELFPAGVTGCVCCVSAIAGAAPSATRAALFPALARRRTARIPFEAHPVPPSVEQQLRSLASEPGVRVDVVTDTRTIQALAELAARGTSATMQRSDFRAELSQWVRNNFTRRPDGMPGFAVGVPNIPSLLAPLMVRLPMTARVEMKKVGTLFRATPLVAVVSTSDDSERAWVNAGLMLERLWLTAVAAGLVAAPYASLVEAEPMRSEVAPLLGLSGFHIQAVLRIGFGRTDLHPSPRRSLESVLVS